jgi:hypothetical protein
MMTRNLRSHQSLANGGYWHWLHTHLKNTKAVSRMVAELVAAAMRRRDVMMQDKPIAMERLAITTY